jgi:hypothetical protein
MAVEDVDETPSEMGRRLFAEGVREFCAGGYFEAHDLWEEFWQELRGPDRRFVQGLIHLAVGTYHFQNGNVKGASSQLAKAATKLSKYPAVHWGVDTRAWRKWARMVSEHQFDEGPPAGLEFDSSLFPAQLPMAPR